MKKQSYDIDPAAVAPQAPPTEEELAAAKETVKQERKQSRLAKASFAWTVISMLYAIVSGAVLISGKWILAPYSYIMAGLLGVYVVIFAVLVVSFAVLGAVFGIGGGPLGGRMIENVPDSDRAGASSILSFIMYFSSALGTALFSGLFNLGSGGSGGSMSDLEPAAFLDGFQFAMLVGIVLAVIALVLTLALRDDRGKKAEVS